LNLFESARQAKGDDASEAALSIETSYADIITAIHSIDNITASKSEQEQRISSLQQIQDLEIAAVADIISKIETISMENDTQIKEVR
jgi:hypothetical protein